MSGREKCKALKEIRKRLAEENNIEFAVSECSFQGECKGTCPKCEEELIYLEKELEKRKRLGQVVAIVGVSAGFMAAAVAGQEVINKGMNNIDETVKAVWNKWAQSEEEVQSLEGIAVDWE